MRRTSTRHGVTGHTNWCRETFIFAGPLLEVRHGSARVFMQFLRSIRQAQLQEQSRLASTNLARARSDHARVLFPAGIRELRLRRDRVSGPTNWCQETFTFAGVPLEEREMEQHDSSCQFQNHVVCFYYGVALLTATAPYKSRPGDGVAYRGVEGGWLKRPQMLG